MVSSVIDSLELWNCNSFDLWMIVLVLKAIALQGILFHFVVVKSAHGIQIWQFLEVLQLFLGLVKIKNAFDAVEVVTHIVFVFEHTQGSFNLVFVHINFLIISANNIYCLKATVLL